jgi:hypothetical protein
VVVLLPACFHPSYDHLACGPDGACPSGWHCAQGFCEPPGSGSGSSGGDDAGVDGPGNASFCLGDAVVMACLAQRPAAPLTISASTRIDTDRPGDCSPDAVGSSASYCILAGSSITIPAGQTLSATGSRPLVLMSSGAITVAGAIDVAGHLLGVPQATGPAVPGSSPCAPATVAASTGGGSGGSFGSIGGTGGPDAGGNPGGVASGPVVPTTLRGGCSGEAGLNGGGAAGSGGGAVALLAVMTIEIDGVINASGGGGGGSMINSRGGGGGGAGGMIVIDAPMVTGAGSANIFANGGGGGEGSAGLKGQNGNDAPPDPNLAATGGSGATTGGDGGNGANKNAQGLNAGGGGGAGTSAAGGGGGGGGVGVIKVYQGTTLPGTVSPPPS